MNATAAAIYAHRHTVAYRLDRVKELSGLDPMQTEDRERLGLAPKAYRIISRHLAARVGLASHSEGLPTHWLSEWLPPRVRSPAFGHHHAMGFSWEPFGRTERDAPPDTPRTTPAPPPDAAPRALTREPARRLAIVICMDCRIDPLRALGLSLGDAVVLRNAGAQVSDDVLRSLQVAHEALGVRSVHVIGHTDCAAYDGDAEVAANEAENGAERIRAVIPGLQAGSGLLDLGTGAVQ